MKPLNYQSIKPDDYIDYNLTHLNHLTNFSHQSLKIFILKLNSEQEKKEIKG